MARNHGSLEHPQTFLLASSLHGTGYLSGRFFSSLTTHSYSPRYPSLQINLPGAAQRGTSPSYVESPLGPEFLGTLDLFRSSVVWKGAGLPGVKLPRAKEKHLVSPWRLESSLWQNRIQNGRRETPWFGGKRRPTKESRGSRRCNSERACFWPHAGAWFKVKLPGRHLPLLHGSSHCCRDGLGTGFSGG